MARGMDRAEMAKAIEDGMSEARARQLNAAEIEVLKAEIERLKAENARLGVMQVRSNQTFACLTTEARYQYGGGRAPGKVARAWWALVGMIVEGVHGWWSYLDAINRGIDPEGIEIRAERERAALNQGFGAGRRGEA